MKRFTGSLVVIVLLTIFGTVAKADPIALTSASLNAGSTNTLSLQGNGLNVQLNLQPQSLPYVYHEGLTTVSLSLGQASGTVVINGVDYSGYNVSGNASFYIDLRNPVDMKVTDTRTITGTLKVTDQGGNVVASLDFKFTAPVSVTLGAETCGCMFVTSVTANGTGTFIPNSPVPEPATMVLLGTGLAGIASRLRRRKQQQS